MTKISISEIKSISLKALSNLGLNNEEREYVIQNLLDAELANKKSHGFVRIPWIKNLVESDSIAVNEEQIEVLRDTPVSLLVDGKGKTGFYVVSKSLDMAIEKAKKSKMVIVGCTNTPPSSGYITSHAKKAVNNGFIFLAFNNSDGGLVPFGSTVPTFGTNPFTVGIPCTGHPFILDMASSKTTWGSLLVAEATGTELPEGVANDKEGNMTTDPIKAQEGGVLPIAGHKGSGLGFVVELLGGALTASRVGDNVPGEWGSTMILIDPEVLRDREEFISDVDSLIAEVKNSPKAPGFKEIYYPGEQSGKATEENLKNGELEIADKTIEAIKEMANK